MIHTRFLTRWQTPGPPPGRGADIPCRHGAEIPSCRAPDGEARRRPIAAQAKRRPIAAEARRRWFAGETGRSPIAGESGDTLIEVLIAAVVIVLVVAATATGLNSANRATSVSRERSQADALAQQNEDELRTRSVNELSELTKQSEATPQEVVKGGTKYTIAEKARYIDDETGTASCTSTSAKAEYIQTTSIVSWSSAGHTESVEETGVVSPPPDAAVIVQVTGASGEPVPNMTVETSGPSAITTETSSDGCAILAISPGEYTLNVHRLNYIDQNGYENSDEDPSTDASFYVVAENSVKKSFEFAAAGELAVKFATPTNPKVTGDTFVAFNSDLTALRTFGELGSFHEEVLSESLTYKTPKSIFPFSDKYIVYAGTCEADMPTHNGQAQNVEALVEPSKTTEVTVAEAPIDMVVYEGTSSSYSGPITSGLSDTITDTGCGKTRKVPIDASGELEDPNLPFGKYTLCVTGTDAGEQRSFTTEVDNDKETGVSVPIYLGEGTHGSSC